MLSSDTDQVFCHSGYEFAERPTAFIYGGERFPVEKVVARWRIPHGKRFLVQTVENRTFILQYDETSSEWSIKQDYKPPES